MNNVCWINTISDDDADSSLRKIYDTVRGPAGSIDNLYRAYSLRPHTIVPADDLYRAVLHNQDNELPGWLAELIATYVAILTGCSYAQTHHGHNFRSLMGDSSEADEMLQLLIADKPRECGGPREAAALLYTRALTLHPDSMRAEDIDALRNVGWNDGEILEIVQIAASFAYSARVINGLGISLDGEKIGFY